MLGNTHTQKKEREIKNERKKERIRRGHKSLFGNLQRNGGSTNKRNNT